MSAPLHNRRIVVTRAAAQAAPLCDAIRAAGGDPVALPTIEIDTTPTLHEIDATVGARYDWIVCTSPNGAAALDRRLRALGIATLPATISVAAVGAGTADALRAARIPVTAQPDVALATAIPDALGDIRGARILWPRGDLADLALADTLRARGAAVDAPVAYRTLGALDAASARAAFGQPVDAVTFASASAVHAWHDALGDDALLNGRVVACIGPRTADALRARGVSDPLVASPHTADGLVQCLIHHFAPAAGALSA